MSVHQASAVERAGARVASAVERAGAREAKYSMLFLTESGPSRLCSGLSGLKIELLSLQIYTLMHHGEKAELQLMMIAVVTMKKRFTRCININRIFMILMPIHGGTKMKRRCQVLLQTDVRR